LILLSSITGLFAGFVHALSGPDHIAAVAPVAMEGKQRSWLIGLRWGFGHASGAVVVGIAALLLRGALPMEAFSSFAERFVGVMLIGIGLWGLHKAFSNKLHVHEHRHGDAAHRHVHVHPDPESHEAPASHTHTHTAFVIGLLHGLAGGSHLLGVLPALALPSAAAAVCYLLLFGAGTILAMAGFASLIGAAAGSLAGKGARAYRGMMSGLSACAIVVGLVWLAM